MLNFLKRRHRRSPEDILELLEKYEDIFPRGDVEGKILSHVSYLNSLFEKGDLHREIRVHLRATKNGIDSFIWRVPHFQNDEPISIRTRVDDKVVIPDITKKAIGQREYTEIRISLSPPMRKGEERVIYLTYDIVGYVKKSRKPFRTEWYFAWVYAVRTRVQSLEVRTELPRNARIRDLGNSSSDTRHVAVVQLDRRQCHVLTMSSPPLGNIPAQITYRTPAQSVQVIFSLITAIPVSMAIEYLMRSNGSVIEFVITILIIGTSIYLSHLIYNRI